MSAKQKFMKVNHSNLLTKLASIVGVTGVSLLMGLPGRASEVLNPNPIVFTELPYNYSERVRIDTISQTEPVATISNKFAQNNRVVAQSSGKLNPRPSILDECPYNRAACGSSPSSPNQPVVVPTPPDGGPSTPAQPGIVVPTPDVPVVPPTTPGADTPSTQPSADTEGQNLVTVAEGNPSFTMLTKALKAAGLVDTLKGDGPYTVFAPTDAAFAKLPQDALQDLLKPENKEVLVKILSYHVLGGKVLSTDLKAGEVKSVEGGPISVKTGGPSGVMVNDANVVQPDIPASNGVIHAIDQVILPPDL